MNVIVLFAADDVEHKDILGGLMLEYHPKSNCGLLCYIVVSPKHKGESLESAMRIFVCIAVACLII